MLDFDVIVIGSGPAAIAALLGLTDDIGRGAKVAVLNGRTTNSSTDRRAIRETHPKVRKEMFEASLGDAICNFLPMQFGGRKYLLFEAACPGGLSRFWGQQLVRIAPADFRPSSAVATYENYETACQVIERCLGLGEPDRSHHLTMDGEVEVTVKSPRLVEPLDALSGLYQRTSARAHVFDRRARRIARGSTGRLQIVSDDGERFSANQAILAAGVLGTARVLVNSSGDLRHCRFSDHAPLLVHAVSWRNRFVRELAPPLRNMNALNIEVQRRGNVQAYASVYAVGQMQANLALAQFGLPMLRVLTGRRVGLSLPYFPIQVWTKSSFAEVDLEFSANEIASTAKTEDFRQDLTLAKMALAACGFKDIHTSTTPPGLGFHHHDLRVSANGQHYETAEEHVANQFGQSVRIADGSVLPRLTPRPHTETLMANAFWVGQSMLRR